MRYKIVSKCKSSQSQQLALAADTNGNITVQLASDTSGQIYWICVYDFANGGALLVHSATGKALAVGVGQFLRLVDLQSLSSASAWDFKATNGGFAIRPLSNINSLNLNVFGSGPYPQGNQVCVWKWGGGVDNEVWTVQQVDAVSAYGWWHSIRPRCKGPQGNTLALSINHSDPYGPVTVYDVDPTDDGQLWTPHYVFYPNSSPGFVFTNKQTGRALRGAGEVSTALLHTLHNQSTWTRASNALRPSDNSDSNLNVFGSGPYKPGNQVVLSGWGKGQPNETWDVVRLTDPNSAGFMLTAPSQPTIKTSTWTNVNLFLDSPTDLLDVWGEGRIIDNRMITGFGDAYNLNKVTQKVSNGPNKGKDIPNLVPVYDYDNPVFPIGDDLVNYITLMGAPITEGTAREMYRVLNKQKGVIILYGLEDTKSTDKGYIDNFEKYKGKLEYKPNKSLDPRFNQITLKFARIYEFPKVSANKVSANNEL